MYETLIIELFVAMARIGTVITLKDWLETPKTYHGPINLRLTWPIELTKTYHIICRTDHLHILNLPGDKNLIVLLYLLGRVCHGTLYRANRNWEYVPPDWMLTVERFYRGSRNYLYRIKYDELGLLHTIKVREAMISAPRVLYIRKFQTTYYESPNVIKINDAEGRLAGNVYPGSVIRYRRYRLDQPALQFGPLTYLEMIKHLIDLVE